MCCLCCKSGPLSGSIRLDRIGFVPGEEININAEIQNLSSFDCDVWAVLEMVKLPIVKVITLLLHFCEQISSIVTAFRIWWHKLIRLEPMCSWCVFMQYVMCNYLRYKLCFAWVKLQ